MLMSRAILVAVFFALTALSGCLGGEEKDPKDSPSDTGGTNGPNCCANMSLTVTILNYTSSANTSEPINVTYEVSLDADLNSTDLAVEHTDVHWGNESIEQPSNTTAYGNQSDEDTGPIGVFNTTFTVMTNGTIYARAHAVLNGSDYWSDEVVIQVSAGIPAIGTVHEIDIGALLPAQLAEYDPDELTIKVGDGVKWTNADRVAPHTATSDEGAPQAFDTGNLAAGAESQVIQFTVPGEYTYHCNVHPDMAGSLTVE